ncbi:synapsin II [Pelomyxa schiedti]|nr:synapsin II [Pelomyxa schiedti]
MSTTTESTPTETVTVTATTTAAPPDLGPSGESSADLGASHKATTSSAAAVVPKSRPRILLVIGGSASVHWDEVFAGATLPSGDPVQVEWAPWEEITLVSYGDSNSVLVTTRNNKGFSPDFLLVRSAARGIHGQDYRNLLYGFAFVGVPSINSLESLYWCQEKPLIYSKMLKLKKKLGATNFPLIEQTYYPSWKSMSFTPCFPLVAKLGTIHAGFGKMKINSQTEFNDLSSIIACQEKYVTAEPFITWDYDFRLQKIGPHYRSFRRRSDNWKGRGLGSRDEDVELSEKHKMWLEQVSAAMGMDILSIDGVHSAADDHEWIIEINDSAIGLVERHLEEDLRHVRELILVKMASALTESAPATTGLDPDSVSELKRRLAESQDQVRALQQQVHDLQRAHAPSKTAPPTPDKKGGGLLGWLNL